MYFKENNYCFVSPKVVPGPKAGDSREIFIFLHKIDPQSLAVGEKNPILNNVRCEPVLFSLPDRLPNLPER